MQYALLRLSTGSGSTKWIGNTRALDTIASKSHSSTTEARVPNRAGVGAIIWA